ncbi:MAG TPA: hypothetical protein VNK96_08665 [Fimbriimonadales bacterium]|nr:hypothetical protein [Fimbriimonadales bacterium]
MNSKCKRRTIAVGAMLLLSSVAFAQEFSNNLSAGIDSSQVPLMGTLAVDVLQANKGSLGLPLRYGGIVPRSVRVEVGATVLSEGTDYVIDYAAGVLYLFYQAKSYETVRVTYRHDAKLQTSSSFSGMPLTALNFTKDGSLRMLLSFSGAQRFSDGTLMQFQTAGLQNNFSFGLGKLGGLFMVSSQWQPDVKADASSPDQNAPKSGVEGTDSLLLQEFHADVSKGVTLDADIQRVGQKFTGFGMLNQTGMDSNKIQQLEKEKGLVRYGLSLNGVNPKGWNFTNSFRTIEDGSSKITFQNYKVKSSNFEAYFDKRKIDYGFNRFQDLAESDRAQLQKEKGIERESLGAKLQFKGNSFAFDENRIGDALGGIERKNFSLETSWLKGSYFTQKIDNAFNRFNDLAEAERGQWAKERGLQREEFSLILPKKDKGNWLSLSQKAFGDGKYGFESRSGKLDFGKFGLEFWNRKTDSAFVRLGDLSANELDSMILQTLQVYDPAAALNPNERNWIVKETGMERNFLRFQGQPFANSNVRLDWFDISDGKGKVTGGNFFFAAKNLNLQYKRTNFDKNFLRYYDLLETERKIIGNQFGFEREDILLDWKVNAKTQFSLAGLRVGSDEGSADRWTAMLKGQGYEVKGGFRNVDDEFARAGDINDSENWLFKQLIGYRQWDLALKFNALKNFNIEGSFYDSTNGNEDLRRYKRDARIIYTPDSKSSISVSLYGQKFGANSDLLFENNLFAMEGLRDFGKWGKLTVRKEQEYLGGAQADKPSRVTDYAKYETKLLKGMDFSTEQLRTQFADGGYEDAQAYRLNYAISKRLSVNATEYFVWRDGNKADQRNRTFGFSYDMGNGFKIGYNWNRELNSLGGGKQNYKWELSGGGNSDYEYGGYYDERKTDGVKTQALGNFSFSTKKPFDFGIFKAINVKFGYDSETDAGIWKRENELASINTTVFGSLVGSNYTQFILPTGQRATERGVFVKMDPTGKKPLQINLSYKTRNIPGMGNFLLRDYDVSYQLNDKLKIVGSTDSFPEATQNGALFGSNLQPIQSRNWGFEYTPNTFASGKFQYEQLARLDQNTEARRVSIQASLFNNTGRPLRLTYGLERNLQPGMKRTRHIWEIGFDQKPGPNQTLSFLIGSARWEHSLPDGQLWTNLILRLDYQVRF